MRAHLDDQRGSRRVVDFLDALDGIDFLHQLHVALHLVFGQANDCGLRALSQFLNLSGLDEFLPASYGALQVFATELETSLAEYGQQQEQQLAAGREHVVARATDSGSHRPALATITWLAKFAKVRSRPERHHSLIPT